MGILVLDTETTGLPVTATNRSYLSPSKYAYYNASRLVELGYAIYLKDKTKGEWAIKSQNSVLVSPDGFKIENSHIHGITQENAQANGQPVKKVLNDFAKVLKTVSKVVAYNANFDINILLAEAYRCGATDFIKAMNEKMIICAMKYAKTTLKLNRSIRLIELHKRLFDVEKEQEHRALSDVYIAAKCFFHLVQQNTKNKSKATRSVAA